MARDIGEWLEGLGLGKYADVLVEHEVDLDVLPELTEPDLEKIGMPLGPRKKLLKAMAALPADPKEHPEATATPAPAQKAPEAERRQLTVMFCDLVGSTELAARLDPEDMRDVIRAYQDAAAGAVTRFEGYVAKYMGDGVLVYFGFPQAHEDDAERAVYAGLDIVEAAGRVSPRADVVLEVRVGIATGHVVVGDLVGEAAATPFP